MRRHAASRRPTWGEGEKAAVGTAIDEASRVWFTVARGRLSEVFYPTPDRACTRSLGLWIANGDQVSDDEHADHAYEWLEPGVPLITITSTDRARRFRIVKQTIADPRSSVVLQRVQWTLPPGARIGCRLEPHVDNCGDDNDAIVLDHLGTTLLAAGRAGVAMALACSRPWRRCVTGSAALRGPADGSASLERAHGHVALLGEIDDGEADHCVLALAFGHTPHEAAHLALGALARGWDTIRDAYVEQWRAWQQRLRRVEGRWWAHSAAVLKSLEAKSVDGGRVAALATPWGPARGPGIDGTYHLVWTRDLVETMGGMLAAGIHDEARGALVYLQSTQHADGHWPHNMLVDGERVLQRDELDESALPILLIDLLRREGSLADRELADTWSLVVRAARYLARTGPSTRLDRWEDTRGVTPFTLATEIAALAYAAAFGDELGHSSIARELRATAERWEAQIDPLLYRRGGKLAELLAIDGYYVRARLPGQPLPELDLHELPPTELSPDALALVRLGLRRPDDPRIRNTVIAIDAVLATELPAGPAWRRYPGDRYGEHRDGAPFDGKGIGRPWPLLIGERAHYELARGHREIARRLRDTFDACANATGMFPEQTWDAPDLPRRGLYRGRPTGSAAPLGWAHAEYVKLCRSLADDRVFDRPSISFV